MGSGSYNDAYHIVGTNGVGLFRSIKEALIEAQITPCKIDAFCAHATSTPVGDASEATIVAKIFGNPKFADLNNLFRGGHPEDCDEDCLDIS